MTRDIEASSSSEVLRNKTTTLFDDVRCPQTECFVRVKASKDGKELSKAHAWPLYMVNQTIPTASSSDLKIEVLEMDDDYTDSKFDQVKVSVTNKGQKPALFVTFESETIPGFFSDNVFMLLSGESEEVVFTSKYK